MPRIKTGTGEYTKTRQSSQNTKCWPPTSRGSLTTLSVLLSACTWLTMETLICAWIVGNVAYSCLIGRRDLFHDYYSKCLRRAAVRSRNKFFERLGLMVSSDTQTWYEGWDTEWTRSELSRSLRL